MLNLIYPGIGGAFTRGEKGTAKSTAVWALEATLPEIDVVDGCPCGCDPHGDALCLWCLEQEAFESASHQVRVVDLPVGSMEDRVVGSLDMETALHEGRRCFELGIFTDANRGILHVDEISLLDDHLVDISLDAAAVGVNTVGREGVSWLHPPRLVLAGTMNLEEEELRPQLLDRFSLCAEVRGMAKLEARLRVMTRRVASEDDPVGFRAAWQERENEIAERIAAARWKFGSVAAPEDIMHAIVELAIETEVDGHRVDIIMLRAVKVIAAWRGDGEAAGEDAMQATQLVLPHRMRREPFQNVGSAKVVR